MAPMAWARLIAANRYYSTRGANTWPSLAAYPRCLRAACCANTVCRLCPVDAKFTILNGMARTYADALKAAGASKIYSDTMSGARDDRPGLAALMDQLRAGDTVVVWKLDRLGRNMLHILETVKALTEMGVTLEDRPDGTAWKID